MGVERPLIKGIVEAVESPAARRLFESVVEKISGTAAAAEGALVKDTVQSVPALGINQSVFSRAGASIADLAREDFSMSLRGSSATISSEKPALLMPSLGTKVLE